VNSTQNPGWTFCWDNFSQFGGLIALASALLDTQKNDTAAVVAAQELLRRADLLLDWQWRHLWRTQSQKPKIVKRFKRRNTTRLTM